MPLFPEYFVPCPLCMESTSCVFLLDVFFDLVTTGWILTQKPRTNNTMSEPNNFENAVVPRDLLLQIAMARRYPLFA